MRESEKWKVKVKSLSRVQLLATPWTVAYLAPPSIFPDKSTILRFLWLKKNNTNKNLLSTQHSQLANKTEKKKEKKMEKMIQ